LTIFRAACYQLSQFGRVVPFLRPASNVGYLGTPDVTPVRNYANGNPVVSVLPKYVVRVRN